MIVCRRKTRQSRPGSSSISRLFASERNRDCLVALALFVTLFLVYKPAWNGKLLWDDERHVTSPRQQSLDGLRRFWSVPGFTEQYYPVVHSAFWLEHRLWGDSPEPYHLVNIALHAAAAVLVLCGLRQLGVAGAPLAAAIFALHPVQVETVAWITELKNTLSGVLCLASVCVDLRFDRTRRWPSYTCSLLLSCLAVLSKSVTATLPAAILVILWWQHGRIAWKRDIAPLLPFFGVGVALGLLSAWFERKEVGAEGPEFAFTVDDRFLMVANTACFGRLPPASGRLQCALARHRWQFLDLPVSEFLTPCPSRSP